MKYNISYSDNSIPKNVYTFWHTENFEDTNIKKIYIHNKKIIEESGYKLIFLTKNNLFSFFNKLDFPTNFNNYRIQKQSDLIRLKCLNKTGGVWLDFTNILLENLNWITNSKSSGILFYAPAIKFNNRNDCYVENWFLAFKKDSYILNKWLELFEKNLILYDDTDKLYESPILMDPEIRSMCGSYMFQHATFLYLFKNDLKFRNEYYKMDRYHSHGDNNNYFGPLGWNIGSNGLNNIHSDYENFLKWKNKKNNFVPFLKLTKERRRRFLSSNTIQNIINPI